MINRLSILFLVSTSFIVGCAIGFIGGKNIGYTKGCSDTVLMYEDLAAPAFRTNGYYQSRYDQNSEILKRIGFETN